MVISKEINDAFFRGERSEKIKYVINDTIEVTNGQHKGIEGAVISVETLAPEVTYIVECFDGTGDIVIPQKNLKLLIPSDVKK